jgi:ketosteroid isomerase-like protein
MKSLLILSVCVVIAGCNRRIADKESKIISVDSLNAMFVDSWNKKDSVTAMRIIAENAVVMNDSLMYKGVNEISKKWISSGIKVVSNIKTVSVVKGEKESIAYDGGTYSLDLTIPGGPVLQEKGNYSFVWTKTNQADWKLTVIHIEDISRVAK